MIVEVQSKFRLIALTLPGLPDPSIAIAASRACGIGILDLEYERDGAAARAALARLARFARGECGLKVDAAAESFVADVTSDLPEQIRVVILCPTDSGRLQRQVRMLQGRNLTILLEATCLTEARLGEQVGVDGLIAKGHEAGGRVGEETTFVLLQRLRAQTALPVWAHGGIGLHTAAACYAAGAAGVVLDAQLALCRESALPESTKAGIARMDGSETVCLGGDLGAGYRMYDRVGLPPLTQLRQLAHTLAEQPSTASERREAWRRAIQARVGWGSPEQHLFLLGQDAAFAAPLAERFRTVGGIFEGLRQAVDTHLQTARRLRPLDAGSPLACSHGTRYPIVQGPMTRVSDTAAFALRVAEAGGLPFLALALMRAPEVEALLDDTGRLLGDRPWGVGILGFVPYDLRQEQLEVIRAHRPSFALIAGGRPDQALALEEVGIPTYLHVPSAGLLGLFVEQGARRFVFEGRECGGHVGPRSSFVLWNGMIDTLLTTEPAADLERCHVLFAGGIHDAVSASMVATMAAPLAARGARIGALLGTAYLFTEEAVATGAITKGFQQEAIRCLQTVLLESGPGHATRCAQTPFAEVFEQERRRLQAEGGEPEAIRDALEKLNLGRLRIASKGVDRHPRYGENPDAPKLVAVSEEEQRLQGMYMIGQAAALRDRVCTIEELHREVAVKGSERLESLTEPDLSRLSVPHGERPSDVAIVGMACLLPKAPDLQMYWENILNKVDAIREVPEDRWDWRRYFDPDPKAPDKIYSRWGGFLEEVPFDPTRYGIPPNTLPSIEPLQLLTLEVVRAALQDAGYMDRPFPRHRTSVILGAGGGVAALGNQYAVRSALPMFVEDVPPGILSRLPEWTEDSFPGILLNVVAGRVANRFDLGGVNYIVDAACASSLAAVHLAARELEAGTSDMVIVGGVEAVQDPFGYLAFSKTHALSPRGRCRTFDESADGIAISEGLAMLVLKRRVDAERDGDRIYAVIRGVAGSSDGRDKGLTAPRPEGQALALERAYAKAGFSPATVGLIEAHGTGTVVGDQTEVLTLRRVFEAAGAARQHCAIGSVKSMIGHTKCTAGVAGLIKTALALHHKVLPPTLHVERPNAKARFPESPFYVNTEPRPWIQGTDAHPRRAGVSAFGFGGTNFHAVLEEYTGRFLDAQNPAVALHWPGELLLWTRTSRQALLEAIEPLAEALARGAKPALHNLAYTLWQAARDASGLTLAMVATSLEDLQQQLAQARETLRTPGGTSNPGGLYFAEEPLARDGKIAFLFSGQGSQYPGMLGDLSIHFPEVREQFELADRVLADRFPEQLSAYIFPPPSFSPEQQRLCQQALTQTNVAQPALGAAGMGLFRLLQALGVRPDLVAGHSYGEYVALCSASVFDEEVLYMLSEARGRCIIEAAEEDLGTMAAVMESRERIREVVQPIEEVWIANVNAPRQTVISGTRQGIRQAIEHLERQGIQAHPIPVACAFHSPVIAPARDRLAAVLSTVAFQVPQLEVFSNASAAPYPADPQAIAALLAEHLVSPVQFADEVTAMYHKGVRIFIEVGPRNVLTSLTEQILSEQTHLAVAMDVPGRSGRLQLLHALGQLAAHGVPLKLDRLYEGRAVRQLNLTALVEETRAKPLPPTTWLVHGGRARPLREAAAPKEPSASVADGKVMGNGKAPLPLGTPASAATSSAHVAVGADRSSVSPTPDAGQRSAEASPIHRTPDPSNGASVPPAMLPSKGEAGRIMLQFQRLMNGFLDTQQQVMLAYLRGSTNGTSASPKMPTASAPSEVSPALELPAQPLQATETPPVTLPQVQPVTTQESPAAEPSLDPEPSDPKQSAANQKPALLTDKEQITQKLLQVVSERTGYPPEMLDLDLNLEADLSIDSIKQVEILGAFQRTYFPPDQQKTRTAMEKLTGIKTLRGIVDLISTLLQQAPTGSPAVLLPEQRGEPASRNGKTTTEDQAIVPRFLLTGVDAPLRDRPGAVKMDGVFVLTDDEHGVAQSLGRALQNDGVRVALVRVDHGFREEGRGRYAANLADPEAVGELVANIRERQGPITGLVHLLPLKGGMPFAKMELAAWRARLDLDVKSLFHLARAAGPDLKQAGESGRGRLMAATSMGGPFASNDPAQQHFYPSQGGVTGLVKTLSLEWPQVRTGVVDLDARASPSELAAHLLAELAAEDGEAEVGYKDAHRTALRAKPAPVASSSAAQLAIDPSWVVLVTGGARGITAEVAVDLAARHRPTLLLVGRSPLPEPEESPQTAGLDAPRALKAALMEQMRRQGREVTPARVEAAYTRLLQDREIRSNLAAMQQAGASVRYHQVDVRDAQAFGDLIEEVYRSYGRLDGVIHGAGVIEDKLIEDKTPDSFDRVLETKVISAFVLSRSLRPESLRFLVFFASVAGCFGNRGQGDYAAANEILNKLALYLDRQWPGRVVSVNWGPWEKTGMVSPEVQRQFAERTVQLIPPEAGRRALELELRYGAKGEVEVVLGAGPWGGTPRARPIAPASEPLLHDAPVSPAK